MRKTIKLIVFIVTMLFLPMTIFPQSFTPQNGVTYNVNLDKWLQDGNDVTEKTRERLSFSIIFNTAYTDFSFGLAIGGGTVRIFNNENMELIRKVPFLRPSTYATGTGTLERVGRSVKISFKTEGGEVNEIEATIQYLQD